MCFHSNIVEKLIINAQEIFLVDIGVPPKSDGIMKLFQDNGDLVKWDVQA